MELSEFHLCVWRLERKRSLNLVLILLCMMWISNFIIYFAVCAWPPVRHPLLDFRYSIFNLSYSSPLLAPPPHEYFPHVACRCTFTDCLSNVSLLQLFFDFTCRRAPEKISTFCHTIQISRARHNFLVTMDKSFWRALYIKGLISYSEKRECVIVCRCHSKQRLPISKLIVLELTKLSLKAACHSKVSLLPIRHVHQNFL